MGVSSASTMSHRANFEIRLPGSPFRASFSCQEASSLVNNVLSTNPPILSFLLENCLKPSESRCSNTPRRQTLLQPLWSIASTPVRFDLRPCGFVLRKLVDLTLTCVLFLSISLSLCASFAPLSSLVLVNQLQHPNLCVDGCG